MKLLPAAMIAGLFAGMLVAFLFGGCVTTHPPTHISYPVSMMPESPAFGEGKNVPMGKD